MNREKDLIKNTVILSIGKLLPKMMAFITLPILTAKLSKAEYGTYDLITTLVMLVIPIATLQIQSAAFRFLIDCRKEKKESSEIITNILFISIPISLLASVLVQFFFANYEIAIRFFISAYLFADTVFLTLGQIVRGLGKNKEYSISAIILSIINMIGLVCIVQLINTGLLGVLISLTVANLVGSSYLAIISKVYNYIFPEAISFGKIKTYLAYSWPMVPNNLSNWILKLSDRLVITAVLGVEANAIYAVANKIPNLLSVAQSVLVMAWHENASIAAKDEDAQTYYSKMLDKMFSLMFGCTALLIAATPIMFMVLIRGDYAEAYYQMPILIIAMFFFVMSSYFGGIYIAYKRTKNVGISTMTAAVINLVINLLLVRYIGIWAGSISTLCAYVVLYFYRMVDSRRFQPLSINLKKQGIQIASLIGMLIICFLQQLTLNLVNAVLAIVLCFVFNNTVILEVLAKVRKRV